MAVKAKAATKKAAKPAQNITVPVKKPEGKCVTVNGDALRKAIAARTEPKQEVNPTVSKYHIWDVYGVKYIMDDNMMPTRRVNMIEVTSDHDTANEPELRNQLISSAERQLMDEGYAMTDADAMEEALFTAERVIDEIRHDIEYKNMCRKCTVNNINDFNNFLKYLRGWRDRRFALARALGGCCNLPPVIPNDYQENWHIEGNRLVPNNRKPKVIHCTQVDDVSKLPEGVKNVIKDLTVKGMIPQMPGVEKLLPPAKEQKKLPPAKKNK